MKNVLIGIPVKNCAEWLENAVNQIINIDYPKQYISIVFLENDSVDTSLGVIKYCCNNVLSQHQYKFIHYEKRDVGFHLPHNSRHDFRHMEKRMNSLKIIRNYIVDTYLKDNDYLWWVDADYKYIPPNFLKDAIELDVDFVMPRVEVDGINYDGATHADISGIAVQIDQVATQSDKTFHPMNLVECAALVSRKVFDTGLRYDNGVLPGNDGTEHYYQEGPHLSHRAKLAGFKLYGSLKHIIVHQAINGTTPFDF